MATQVTHYGVHWAPGKIAFLQQQRAGSNAISLQQVSPFKVRAKRGRSCNHLIQLNVINPAREHLIVFEKLVLENSLVQFMLPIPGRPKVGVISSKNIDLFMITLLLKMSSPIKLPVFRASLTGPRTIMEELTTTNVQPLVLDGVTAKQVDAIKELMAAAEFEPRRLLLIVNDDVPIRANLDAAHMMDQDDIDLAALPWETLGAIVLRAYMRQEWDGTWFLREPTPGDETKAA